MVTDRNIAPLPMVEWRDPVEEDIERNLESVSKITGTANNASIPAIQIYEVPNLSYFTSNVFVIRVGKKLPNASC